MSVRSRVPALVGILLAAACAAPESAPRPLGSQPQATRSTALGTEPLPAHASRPEPLVRAAVVTEPVVAEPVAPAERLSAAEYLARADEYEGLDDYENALKVYDGLLGTHARFEGRDEIVKRRNTLAALIELAATTYEKATLAPTRAEEVRLLRLIQSFWPGYKDVSSRLDAARQELREKGGKGNR